MVVIVRIMEMWEGEAEFELQGGVVEGICFVSKGPTGSNENSGVEGAGIE